MKRFCLFLLFFISFRSFALVAPILPNEGVWNVVTRLGTTIDAISTGGLGCDIVIQQSDIGDGGIFTISGSDLTYCLSENITFTFGDAIEITGSNIILDLNNKVIDGLGLGDTAIEVNANGGNLIIKNGTIKNTKGIVIPDEPPYYSYVNNVSISDIQFFNCPGAALEAEFTFFDGCTIEDCRMIDCGNLSSGSVVSGAGTFVVRRCVVEETRDGSADVLAINIGAGGDNRYALVEDCVITATRLGDDEDDGVGICLDHEGGAAVVRRCVVTGKTTGIENRITSDNVLVQDCLVQAAEGPGFDFSFGCVLQNCVSLDVGTGFLLRGGDVSQKTKIINCIASHATNSGFDIVADVGESHANIEIRNCCAQENGVCGFEIISRDSMQNVLLENCVAINNGGDGFWLQVTNSGFMEHLVVRNCVAQNNVGGAIIGAFTAEGNGYSLAPTGGDPSSMRDVIFEDCIAEGNAADGFDIGSTSTLVKVIDCAANCNGGIGFDNNAGEAAFFVGNSSIRNAGGDYTGITDLTKIVSFNFPGAFMGAGRWVNSST